MRQIISLIFVVVLLHLTSITISAQESDLFSNLPCTPSSNADLTITGGQKEMKLSLGTSSYWAGAINSLKINDTETVLNTDPGLLLQYAFSINNQGETENPTEGGSAGMFPSSSKFIEGCSNGKALYTKSQIAYWYPFQGATLSPFTLSKIVEIGVNNNPNLIRFTAKIETNLPHGSWQLETPCGYHTPAFNSLKMYNPATNQIIQPVAADYSRLIGPNDPTLLTRNLLILSNGEHSLIPYYPSNVASYLYSGSGINQLNKWTIFTNKARTDSASTSYYESYLLVAPNSSLPSAINKLIQAIPPKVEDTIPLGWVESATNQGLLKGWDYDENGERLTIDFYIDPPNHRQFFIFPEANYQIDNRDALGLGRYIGSTATGLPRPDLINNWGTKATSSGWQFQVPLEYLADNKSHLIVGMARNIRLDNNILGNNNKVYTIKTIAPFSITQSLLHSPVGTLETIDNNGLAYGWAIDQDGNIPAVDLYLDSPTDLSKQFPTGISPESYNHNNSSYGTYLGTITPSRIRVDVVQATGYGSTTAGFEYQIDDSILHDGKSHTLTAIALDGKVGSFTKNHTILINPLLPLPALTPITPTNIPGDLNNDNIVNTLDFNTLVGNYKNPYTILDFNNIVSNWGKQTSPTAQ